MGRYYNGEIEGKFWFGVQSSDAADRFGCIGEQPQCLNYYFEKDHMPSIRGELEAMKSVYGPYFEKLDVLVAKCAFTQEDLCVILGVDANKLKDITSEYADYLLGRQILNCIEEKGSCYFEAEL